MGLMRRGMRERARAVDAAMEDLVALCRGAVTEVFGEVVEGGGGVGGVGARAESNEPRSAAAEFAKDSSSSSVVPQPPPSSNQSSPLPIPIIKPFERLSLLGSGSGSKGE